jgi:hypothetical protein
MGWKSRNGRAYYYKSERQGGRVTSTYFGAGLPAQAVAIMDQEAREEREAARAAWEEERGWMDEEECAAREMFERVEAVAEAALLAAGYRRHNRGEWRRARR